MSRHIKVINGKKYYYRSIRKGNKVTSEYIGPVERIRKKKARSSDEEEITIEETTEDDKEDDYIG